MNSTGNNHQVWSYEPTARRISDHVLIYNGLSQELAISTCKKLSSSGSTRYYTRQFGEPTYIVSMRYTSGVKIAHSTHYNEADAARTRAALIGATGVREVVTDIRYDNADRNEDLSQLFDNDAIIATIPSIQDDMANTGDCQDISVIADRIWRATGRHH